MEAYGWDGSSWGNREGRVWNQEALMAANAYGTHPAQAQSPYLT
jgi:hypothetical protein